MSKRETENSFSSKKNRSKPKPKQPLAKVTFNDLLPSNFVPVINGLQARTEQQSVISVRDGTLSDAYARLSRVSPEETETVDQLTIRRLQPSVENSIQAIFDPLENYRRELGLDIRREKIMGDLIQSLSFESGIRDFESLIDNTESPTQVMSRVNKKYPDLTMTEVFIISLCVTTPMSFLSPYIDIGNRDTSQIIPAVPRFIGLSGNGFISALDSVNPNRVSPNDGYSQIGISGKSENSDIVPFKPILEEDIEELVSLSVTNYRLHERIWNNNDTSILNGLFEIDSSILDRLFPGRIDIKKPISPQLSILSAAEHRAYLTERQIIDQRNANHVIMDFQTGKVLDLPELVRLSGLLDKPISWLVGNQPDSFVGFFVPHGPGVLIMDVDGQPLTYHAYKPFYLREAVQGLYYESKVSEKNNRTYSLLFNQLALEAEGKALSSGLDTGEQPSILEGIRIEMKLRWGIDLVIAPQTNLIELNSVKGWFNPDMKVEVEPAVKFGEEEAQLIYKTLNLLPAKALENVKAIKKIMEPVFPAEELLTGYSTMAEYVRVSKTIVIRQIPSLIFGQFSPEMKAQKQFTLIHEVGHGFWDSIPSELQDDWTAISWADGVLNSDNKNGFLTAYSYQKNEQEDFCEHLAAFVLTAEEFRQKALTNSTLLLKYEMIQEILERVTGQKLNYAQQLPYTIEGMHVAIDDQITALSLREVVELKNSLDRQAEVVAKASVNRVSTSLNKTQVEDIIRPDYSKDDEAIFDGYANHESYTSFKRSSVSGIIDYIAEDLTEVGAIKAANSIYQLIEEGEPDKALSIIRRIVSDKSNLPEILELLLGIEEQLKSNTFNS